MANPLINDQTVQIWAADLFAQRNVDWKTIDLEQRKIQAARLKDFIDYLIGKWYEVMYDFVPPK